MLLDAAQQWQVDLSRPVMVGDRWRDIAAGKAAGCRTVLMQAAYAEPQAEAPDAVAASLEDACRLILTHAARTRPAGGRDA